MRAALSATTTHIPLILTKTSALIWWLLYASCVHQMESAFVLIVVVSILTATAELRLILTYANKGSSVLF
jgi:hypothetical protein